MAIAMRGPRRAAAPVPDPAGGALSRLRSSGLPRPRTNKRPPAALEVPAGPRPRGGAGAGRRGTDAAAERTAAERTAAETIRSMRGSRGAAGAAAEQPYKNRTETGPDGRSERNIV